MASEGAKPESKRTFQRGRDELVANIAARQDEDQKLTMASSQVEVLGDCQSSLSGEVTTTDCCYP